MDVDTSSYHASPVVASMHPVDFSPVVVRPAGQELFFETLSPRRSFESPSQSSRKRRSLSPESHRALTRVRDMSQFDSSPMVHSSPSESKMERIASSKGGSKPSLQGLGAPSENFGGKRARRPVLSEMIHPVSDFAALSAHPDMGAGSSSRQNLFAAAARNDSSPLAPPPPVRRAFSALLPPSIYTQPDLEDTEPESSFDGADMSSPAQAYAKRQHVKTIRRCDGTEDFRPLTGIVSSMGMASQPNVRESPSAKFMAPGLGGFGDNEAHGKILPCHRVREDGLMRISVKTVRCSCSSFTLVALNLGF